MEKRLGEGTRATLSMSIIQSTVAVFTLMSTFSSAGVSERKNPVCI
jgi:NaMN:DMB phosphoribosyltransferase